MNKNRRLAFLGLTCATMLYGQSLCAATSYEVNDWYVNSATASSISHGGTSSATINYNDSSRGSSSYIWAYFAPDASPVQLGDGMTLTLSTNITINYASASSARSELRFGLYNSGPDRASTSESSYGPSRSNVSITNVRQGWTGFFTASVSSGAGTLYKQVPSNVYPTAGGAESTAMADSALQQTYNSGQPIALTLSLVRTGNDLSFSGVYGSDTFSGTYANAFNDYADTFNAVGFFVGTPGFGADLVDITFANTTVTLIPEPTTTAMALVVGGGLLLHFKQRRKAKATSAALKERQ